MRRIIVNSLIISFLIAQSLAAEEMPGMDKESFFAAAAVTKKLEIAMVDCVAMALKNNSEILVKQINPHIEDENVRIQKSLF